ncbi:MAG: cysteine--tRNA ligase [Deltaproteobacteria bacterium]|nr:cysteine--tRNA ligase [Deltaproteobacteria bacterium]
MTIRVYNVLTGKKETFSPLVDGEVSIYVCGITVYGRCHVGHLRCYLAFDTILRYLTHRGYNLKYVRNFTDIDDKIIKRAQEIVEGPDGEWKAGAAYELYDEVQWEERLAEDREILNRAEGTSRHLAEIVSDYFIDVFRADDFGPFNLLEPMEEPRVSEHIPQVVELIEKIIERGFAYEVEGDVYFDVPAYHDATGAYGVLSGRDYTQLVDGARVAPTDKKRSGPDFALWKSAAPGEPAWNSPWGPGRPGWHIECSAMSVDKLGQPFDIHGGGKDLVFPHHENEIAQSEAATGDRFCNTWMHNGFVTVDGVKMSKSLGNFISIKDALETAPPEVWRLLVLGTHYANPIDFSRTREANGEESGTVRGTIDIAFDRLEYFYETLKRASDIVQDQEVDVDVDGVQEIVKVSVLEQFTEAMDDDFNTARALAAIGEGMRFVNELADMKAKKKKKLQGGRPAWIAAINKVVSEISEACGVLGLCARDPAKALGQLRDFAVEARGLDREAIEKKIAERDAARADKDWARSDVLRDELKEMSVELRDSPTGTEWKVVR